MLNSFVKNICGTLKQITFFDVFFYFFALCIARQYFWIVSENYQIIAWLLSAIFGFLLWLGYFIARVKFLPYTSKTVWWFYLLFLPALIWYLIMAIYPDASADTASVRLLTQEFSLLKFPSSTEAALLVINVTPEMMNGIFRLIFGMRLGTLINFILIAWVIYEIKELLFQYSQNKFLIILTLIFSLYGSVLVAQGMHIYFLDFHAIPLIVMMIRLVLRNKSNNSPYKLLFLSVMLGLIFSIKYSHLAFIAPIGIVGLINQWRLIVKKPYILLSFFAFFIPSIPFMLYNYFIFKNPLFPLYNGIFKSPYSTISNFKDGRWGPKGLLEAVVWPFKIILQREVGFGELRLLKYYDGRLTIGYAMAILAMPYFLIKQRYDLLKVCFILILGIFLWSISTGYCRYMISFEYVSFMLAFIILTLKYKDKVLYLYKVIVIILTVLSFYIATHFHFSNDAYNWTWVKFDKKAVEKFVNEYSIFLYDRDNRKFFSKEDLEKVDKVELWWADNTLGYLINQKPILKNSNRLPEERNIEFFNAHKNKKISILFDANYLDSFIKTAYARSYELLSIEKIKYSYFSKTVFWDYYLIHFKKGDEKIKYSKELLELSANYDGGKIIKSVADIPAIQPKEILNNDDRRLLFNGFNQSEISHRWSNNTVVSISFNIDNVDEFKGVINLTFGTYGSQSLKLFLNGVVIANLPKGVYNGDRKFKYNRKLLTKGANNLTFELPYASNGNNAEQPLLGIALNTIELE